MATLADVAQRAGVSAGTVSLVINGSPRISPATRERVLAAVQELGYVPNASARSLATKRQRVLGIVRCIAHPEEGSTGFCDTVDTYLSDMLYSIERASLPQGYSLMIDWAGTQRAEDMLPPLCLSGKADGVILVGGMLDPALPQRLSAMSLPTVLAGSRCSGLSWVDTDYEAAMELAIDHLYAHGHRRIALINGPDGSQSSPLKRKGFLQAMRRRGLSVPDRCLEKGDFSGQGGYLAMQRLLSASEQPTALIAAADCMAVGALRAFQEQGGRCPEQLSVIGFEDGLLAEYCYPPLTSISSGKTEIGRAACELLMQQLQSPDQPPKQLLIAPKLISRASVRTLPHIAI